MVMDATSIGKDQNMVKDRREAFTRLIEKRMPKALDAIRLVGQLGAKNNYEYTDEEAERLRDLFYDKVDEAMSTFGIAGTKQVKPDPAFVPGGSGYALINAAMEALDDGDPEAAMEKLKEVMTL